MDVNVRVIPSNLDEELRDLDIKEGRMVDGFCKDTMTLTFTANPHCNFEYQGAYKNDNAGVTVNNFQLLNLSLDTVESFDKDVELWIASDGPCSVQELYRIIDAPAVHYDEETNRVYEHMFYFFDRVRGVCIQVRSSDDDGKNGYYRILRIWVTPGLKKVERINNFIYGFCTTKPMAIPNGQTRDDVNRAWDVKHGITRPDNK